MEDLSLHILDIAENAIRAEATRIEIVLTKDDERDLLTLAIRDNGKGMDAETLKRIRDPFFTTKLEKGGTGLGLSIANKIIKENNGKIEVASEEGKGTTFTITLPI